MSEEQGEKRRSSKWALPKLILSPTRGWESIEGSEPSVHAIYTRLVIPVAAVGPVSLAIRKIFVLNESILETILSALVSYGLIFAFPALIALVVEKLALILEGKTTPPLALQLVAYSFAPWALLGVLNLFPPPAQEVHSIVGFYSLYLFYTGIPVTTQVPEDREFAFFFTTLLGVLLLLLFDLAVLTALGELGNLR